MTQRSPAERRRHGQGGAVVAAGGGGDGVKASAHGVHRLREGDAVLLGAGWVAAVELDEDLAQAGLALDVAGPCELGVADLGVDDVLEGLEALLHSGLEVRRNAALGLEVAR